ncbi:MAG: hypothetical protein ACOC93_02450, partial [Planctomycetota bacterium]
LSALRPVVTLVLGALLDLFRQRARPTSEDADPDRDTRQKLRAQVRRYWPMLLAPLIFTGCTRTIYVPHGTPVRLRETVEDVKVWVKDADGEPVPGRMDLMEGWFSLPMPANE